MGSETQEKRAVLVSTVLHMAHRMAGHFTRMIRERGQMTLSQAVRREKLLGQILSEKRRVMNANIFQMFCI